MSLIHFLLPDRMNSDPVSEDSPLPVKIVGAGGDINLTGDVIVDTFGALDDAAESDPDAASATIPALLRGILAEMQAQTALLTEIRDNTADEA